MKLKYDLYLVNPKADGGTYIDIVHGEITEDDLLELAVQKEDDRVYDFDKKSAYQINITSVET